MAGTKTEKATPKRLRLAREQGQVSSSVDLTGSCVLAAGLLTIALRADGIAEAAREVTQRALGFASGSNFDAILAPASLGEAAALAAAELAPVLLAMVLCGVLVAFVQVGPIFTLEPLRPRLDRVDPLLGSWKRYLSGDALVVPLMASLKFVVLGSVTLAVLYSELGTLLSLSRADVGGAIAAVARVLARILIWATSALFFLGLLDLFHQRSKLAKRLRMSREEKLAESREAQGGTQAKSARRRLGLNSHGGLVGEQMRQAHFVVIEPSGAACAFRWVHGEDAAPRLVAKGIGPLAAAMAVAARRLGVPSTVDVALARGGYQMEVGQVIGEELFDAARSVVGSLAPSAAQ